MQFPAFSYAASELMEDKIKTSIALAGRYATILI